MSQRVKIFWRSRSRSLCRERSCKGQGHVTVKAEDLGTPRLAGFCTFRVRIGDRNDNPPVFNLPHYTTSIDESSTIGRRVKQVYRSIYRYQLAIYTVCFSFRVGLFFSLLSAFRLSSRSPKITRILTLCNTQTLF